MISNVEWMCRAVEEFTKQGSDRPHTHATALFFQLGEELKVFRMEGMPDPEGSVQNFLKENPLGDNQ